MKPITDRTSSDACCSGADLAHRDVVAGSTAEAECCAASGAAATALLILLRGYKVLISPSFAGSCRFLPSCADYAREAVMRHGALRGGWLAVKRLARCHPFCAAGHDAVPLDRRALPAGRLARLGATPDFHHGLLRRLALPRRPTEWIGLARQRHEQVARAAVGAGGGAPGQ